MKNSYVLNGLVLKIWLKQPNVSLYRCYLWVLSKNVAEWDRRDLMGGRLLNFHYLLFFSYASTASDLAQYLHMSLYTLVFLIFLIKFPPNHKTWVCCSYSVYSVWKLSQLLLQYTVPGSSQVMLLQFITINCFILEQTILMRQSGFKLIQKRHNWKVSSLFVLFLLTRFYDMTRLQIALFMINWQLCKLYMLKAICCTSCSGKNS